MKDATELPLAAGARQAAKTRSNSGFVKLALLLGISCTIYLRMWSPSDLKYSAIKAESVLEEWKDDIWPLRPPTPWDISTDYPFPRKLEYDVDEGTWMRLDVNPQNGDIIFDMLGDIYCLPSSAYLLSSLSPTAARPVLLGVPHDSDPHFSPDGKKLVFRSDAELGYENIWFTEWKGCDAMDVRSDASEELVAALQVKDEEEEMLAKGIVESMQRKRRRLIREGRAAAHRVTNETHRWVSDARWHPSGTKVVATKWHFSSRSLGAGEGWEYAVPDTLDEQIEPGSGKRLVGRTLPIGWGPEDYGDQQIGPEQFIWQGDDTVIYAKNVADTDGQFTYSKDVHSGIYAIYSTNLTSQQTHLLVSNNPGGASRPELSRDGRTLAFVRRVRDKEILVFKDLITGTIHHIWDGLSYDLSAVFAPMGTYPSFAFATDDSAVIIWAAGKIWHIPVVQNSIGERIASRESPKAIPFTAHVEKRLAETVSTSTNLVEVEEKDTERIRAFTDLHVNDDGTKAVFQASGKTYVYDIESGRVAPIPTLDDSSPYFSPSFAPGSSDIVVQARWSDTNFTTFELANVASGAAVQLVGLPQGRFSQPVLCACSGRKRLIAFVKTASTYLTGDVVATSNPGLYVGEITLPHHWSKSKHDNVEIKNVRFVSPVTNEDYTPTLTKIRFLEVNKKLLVQQSTQTVVIDLAAGPDKFGVYKHETVATGVMPTEVAAVPLSGNSSAVAFVDYAHVYFAPSVKSGEPVWSKPGRATKDLTRLSVDGGHHVVFSGDGKKLFWFLGPYLHYIELSKLDRCKDEIKKDELTFGIACTKGLLEYQEIVVEYETDVSRLKKESHLYAHDEQARAAADFVVFSNATLLTMESGNLRHDVLRDAVLVTRGGVIEAIVGVEDFSPCDGATVIDAQGGYIVPGFIDVHAHWNGFGNYYPARSWELETFLAYGITTLHNPSSDNVYGSDERFRVERGQLNGPRIFHVGNVIYGGEAEIHQEINSMEEAYSALIRIKAEGGPSSWSYKNYNLPSRAMRQRLLLAARKLGMLCVPEGGMNYDWDQTYIVDGMTTVEHALPVPRLYDDIMTLFAHSGTGLTPTHLVNYGGAWGEQYVWAHEDIPNDPKLRRFTRHDILESLSESTARPRNSYALFNTSESTAKMVHMGLKAHIGAHGEPPLGLNYHEEMFFAKLGGLTNYEVIRAATSDAAKTLGLYSSLGSLTPGKLADFVVYPPGFDILDGDIHRTRDIRYVVRGGRVWDAETMVEVWPVKGRRSAMPPFNPED